jgi:hypothetical protein
MNMEPITGPLPASSAPRMSINSGLEHKIFQLIGAFLTNNILQQYKSKA